MWPSVGDAFDLTLRQFNAYLNEIPRLLRDMAGESDVAVDGIDDVLDEFSRG